MKKLFGLGIFILIFIMSVGLSMGQTYESEMDPVVFNAWEPAGEPVDVERYVVMATALNTTGAYKKYTAADVYVLLATQGHVILAYKLYTSDGKSMSYELDPVTDAYKKVEKLEEGKFIERFEARVEIKNKKMGESALEEHAK